MGIYNFDSEVNYMDEEREMELEESDFLALDYITKLQ